MTKPKHSKKSKSRSIIWIFTALFIIAALAGIYYLYLNGYFGGIIWTSDAENPDKTVLADNSEVQDTGLTNPAASSQSDSVNESGTTELDQSQETAVNDSIIDMEVEEETVQESEKSLEKNITIPNEIDINIYFSDSQGEFLVGEKRHVEGEDILLAVANELIKGPTLPDVYPTIPDGTVVRNVEIGSGIAYVNFSRELVVNHPKGAAAETMTVYSIVNTMTGITGVNAVQILIEGVKIKSIEGHIDISKPLMRNESIIKK